MQAEAFSLPTRNAEEVSLAWPRKLGCWARWLPRVLLLLTDTLYSDASTHMQTCHCFVAGCPNSPKLNFTRTVSFSHFFLYFHLPHPSS